MTTMRLATLLGLLGYGFLASALAADSDSVLKSRLVGTWTESRLVDEQRHDQRITLRKDGTFEVRGTLRGANKSTPFVWRGTWQVKNGKFIYTSTYSDPADIAPVGESLEDTIVSVSEKEWVMNEQSTGNQSRARRVR
jgi:hypothetical protein